MQKETAIIVGAGPCGMSAAIELKKIGIDPLLIEKGNIVDTIYRYPTHQTFFSSSDKLEIGEVAFVTPKPKPQRLDALVYYRNVAERKALRIHNFEKVEHIESVPEGFVVHTRKERGEAVSYEARYVIIATGYYDQPNYMNVPGEDLPKVSHYFKEAHPFYQKKVVVIGGKNSSVDAALELHRAGAQVTVLYRGSEYSPSIKPWILPEFDSLVKKEKIQMVFNAYVQEIKEDEVIYQVEGKRYRIPNDYVFAMTGYRPDLDLLQKSGVRIDMDSGSPMYNEHTFETNVDNLFIAGVVAAGFNNNKIFIENGRFHGGAIAAAIAKKQAE